MAEYSVLIIGAGTKGALGPVSHAEAFSKPPFKIVGFVDKDIDKARQAAERWGGAAYTTMGEHFTKNNPVDVAVIAVPDDKHEKVLRWWVRRPARLIFAEKPFTRNATEAKVLLEAFRDSGQTVAVNYTRRFVPGFMSLRQDIQGWGRFLGGSAFYTKGLHNLCHWVDTFLMLGIDPMQVNYIDIDRSALNVFEAFLYFEGGRVNILNFGHEWTFAPSCNREDFPQEKVVGCNWEVHHSTSLHQAMEVATHNIADHLTNGTPLLSTAENAVRVLEICEALS